jgi:hypothetical protein
MQQATLDLDHNENARPGPVMEPERQQQLITLMAQAIAAVVPSDPGEDHEAN